MIESIWFAVLAAMLTAYVVLDGFDFGAGIVHLFVAKTDEERRTVLGAIGPVWDGNEVWLVASGGMLVFAFPRVYAAAASGLYLPIMMVLWLLVLRGTSIEFRSQQDNPLWRAFWDAVFALSSTALAALLGVTLGNVVRGFPIDRGASFSMALFTDFQPGPYPGALDWYTILVGGFAFLALAAHGALYLAWKTAGDVNARASRLGKRLCIGVAVALPVMTLATANVNPSLYENLGGRVWSWPLFLGLVASVVVAFQSLRRAASLRAFLASSAFLATLLGLTAAGLYPTLLRSTIDPGSALTVHNAASSRHGLVIGFYWWTPAIALAIGYFVFIFRMFRGKVTLSDHDHG